MEIQKGDLVYVKTLETLLLEGWDYHPKFCNVLIKDEYSINKNLCNTKQVIDDIVSVYDCCVAINKSQYFLPHEATIKL
jgi:hypothetical protein